MLPNLPVNNCLFDIVIFFNGNVQGILCRQNTGRSSKLCPSLISTPAKEGLPCCSSYTPEPLLPQGLCTCHSLSLTLWLPLDLQPNATCSWGLPWPALTLEPSSFVPFCSLLLPKAHVPRHLFCELRTCSLSAGILLE